MPPLLASEVARAREPNLQRLLGRQEERYRLEALLDEARDGHGGAVVLRGEAGIGKSTLLEELADKAHDFCICHVVGVESEMELAYAALEQLCGPIIDRLTDLPALHRNALEKVFGLRTGSPPDRFLVGVAAFDLVATVAQEQPLLWLVDDAHWLDRSSIQVLGFAGRRSPVERVVLVIAARDSADEPDLAGVPQIRLEGLSNEQAGTLLDSVVTGPTDPAVRDRIIAESHGNPLALLELPRAWTAAEVVEGLFESERVPVTGQLELAFARQVRELPSDTQTLLSLAAAEPTGDPALLWSASQKLGLEWGAAAPAEMAGLIEIGGRVSFRHPLVRSAAYRAAPVHQRLAVHRALADVTDPVRDPDRRAWHRASSTIAHDEVVAAELEQSAGRATARGGLSAAAALLERAAALTADAALRADRTLAAASAKRKAGALEAALHLLRALETAPASELRSALTEQLRGKIAFDQRRGRDAATLLLSAARRLAPYDSRQARDTLVEALAAAVWASGSDDHGLIQEVAEAALASPPTDEHARTADLLLDALARRVTEGYEGAAPAMTRALAAVSAEVRGPHDVERTLWMAGSRAAGIIATETWDYQTGRELAERQVSVARRSGALVQLQFALNFLANNVVLSGDMRRTAELVEEERVLSTMTGVTPVGYSSLLLDAFRGDAARAIPMIDTAVETAKADGQGRILAFANYVGAVLYNGLGRHADALDCAHRVFEWGALGYQTLAAAELAEAASRVGDSVRLAEVSAWIRARADATPTEWALGICARVHAFAADTAGAEVLYRQSIEHLAMTPLRVELARSHLLYGEWLRREGSRASARDQLILAHDALNDMGIDAFAQRARREMLATTGRRMRRYVDAPSTELTSQELQIAELVQRGLSNREVGARLFLSPRTVEWHLRNVFGKTGVSSRRQLRDKNLTP